MKMDFVPEADNWRDDPEPERDFKKYILMFGLGALSWVATYIGMLELIQANLGALPFTHKVVIGFSVAMLMVMIIWLLDQMFKPHIYSVKLAYIGGYLFLTLISVGFGFGFYWKVLESRTEASRSAESAVSQVQSSLNGASIRLEQLQATLTQLAEVSETKSELERTKGTSCPNSRPGDGPRRKMRAADAAKFLFSSQFVAGRVGAIKGDMQALDGDLAKIAKKDPSIIDPKSGTRNAFMRALGRKLDMTVAGFNAFRTDPQLKQMRSDLAQRADQTIFKTANGKTFVCPDPQLQQALRGAVRALDQLPVLDKPEIAVVEGSEATIEAFRRLTATLQGALTFRLPPTADELRELQQKAIRQAVSQSDKEILALETAGLSSRDYVPLAIAIFVDLCLLLVSMGRAGNRIENLVPKMRAAERGPVIEILSRFKDIHKDPDVRENFEVFRHVVFDQNGDYYVAVPLDAPYTGAPGGSNGGQYGTEQAQELQHEAHLLANLFTSFEKERIFRRVYNPVLLNTRAIQKRLARQGSKFAGCEAFRVYKFRDGAWSEIILGAVMGAARRAETKRRRAEFERELFGSSIQEPKSAKPAAVDHELQSLTDALQNGVRERTETAAFDLATATSHDAGAGHTGRDRHDRAGAADYINGAAAHQVQQPSASAPSRPSTKFTAEHEAKYGPYAVHVNDDDIEGDNHDNDDALALGASEADVELRTAHNGHATGTIAAFDATPSEPQPTRTEECAADDVPVSSALDDNASLPDARAGSAVAALDTSEHLPETPRTNGVATTTMSGRLSVNTELNDAPHVDVVFTRDTATVSVPVTEATLPNGVAQLMQTALAAAASEMNTDNAAPAQALSQREAVVEIASEDDVIALPYTPEDTTENDEVEEENSSYPTAVAEANDGEDLTRLASRFAAHTDS